MRPSLTDLFSTSAWVVSAEVFPLSMRARGMSISAGQSGRGAVRYTSVLTQSLWPHSYQLAHELRCRHRHSVSLSQDCSRGTR